MKQIFYNAEIITMDSSIPFADSILIEDGKVSWIGNESDLSRHNDSNTVCTDLNGACILPGFIDPHSHITAVAYQASMVDISGPPVGDCTSIADIIKKCKDKLNETPLKANEWLFAKGYDPLTLTDGRSPNRHDLDEISSEIPICFTHISGHMAVLNTAALKIVGYSGTDYTVPEGGEIEYDDDGVTPNGIIKENAWLSPAVISKIPVPSPEQIFTNLKDACHIYTSYGITTCQDAKTTNADYQLLCQAAKNQQLPLDVVSYVSETDADEILSEKTPFLDRSYSDHYRVAGYKTFIDGSPQAKTAWLSKPYYITPENEPADYCGFPTQSEEELYQKCLTCIENDWQINAHCNGDAACERYINAYTRALEDSHNTHDLRPVMIHAQTVRNDQLDRMKDIGMMPSYFLDHIYYWGDAHYNDILGPERASHISPLRTTILKGINCTFHQDSPVVKPNMLFSIHNAVNRKTYKGRVLGPNECVSVMDALKCATLNGAYQIFEEDKKGSLSPGKLADFIILEENPLTVEKEHLKDIKILSTYKEGNCIYKNE